MKIHHVAIYTPDLERLRKFYCSYFGARSNELYHNEKTDLMTYFLIFEDGSRLEIMTKPELSMISNKLEHYGFTHIAIDVKDKEQVNKISERLESDGYEIESKPRVTGDGYYESCVLDPDGNKVEIMCLNN